MLSVNIFIGFNAIQEIKGIPFVTGDIFTT